MKENVLIDRSIDFGSRIVKLHRYLLKTKHEGVLSKQILRSGTSIGANINEAQYGNSRADFVDVIEKTTVGIGLCSDDAPTIVRVT